MRTLLIFRLLAISRAIEPGTNDVADRQCELVAVTQRG